eukprot:CAMPEP_0182428434 /NCGR_PEP_ID=MMETSP1167-20130531/23026_1 /TAXON_ID=2988 /ORGANISM="Mallomonas Sp, Strain CCMP3275" /LENGTH=59 /DNA_ID=CAMNT_0024611357 /DNA_START=249 /DNA_END=428 /DNA_ORIENTATION=+
MTAECFESVHRRIIHKQTITSIAAEKTIITTTAGISAKADNFRRRWVIDDMISGSGVSS